MKNLEIDVTLVEKAKQGNREALEELCKSSMRSIYYVALKILKNEADAEDIMSDTMVTVVEKLNTLSEPAAYISWINRITVNKCKNFLAKNKPIYLGEEETEVIENAELENYNEEFLPEEFVLSKEKTAALMEIIKEKTTYAEMMSVIMFYYNGDSIKTIASEMNCAEITVKTRLASARKKIKNGLEEKFGKGVMLMAATGLFVLGKALKAEAAEVAVPEAVALAAVEAATGTVTAAASGATAGVTAETAQAAVDAVATAGNPGMNVLGKKIGKEVGKQVVKKSIKGKIILGCMGVVAAAGISIGVALMVGNSGEGDGNNGTKEEQALAEENKRLRETYKLIYETSDGACYYANANEEVREFSGYGELDKYFYNNVTCGHDDDYKHFLMDINEKYIVEPGTYDYIGRKSEKYFFVTKDNNEGIIDYEGKVVIPLDNYTTINFYEDEGVSYFITEKSDPDEYVLINETGKQVIKSNEDIAYDIEMHQAYTSNSVDTVLYDGDLYSLKNGEKLLTGLSEGTYFCNLYYCDNKLTIYDESFNVKAEIDDFKYVGTGRDDEDRLTINSDKKYYLNDKYELVEIEKEDGSKHTLDNGEKYSSEIDEESQTIFIYDESGKKLHSISFDGMSVNRVYSHGNYLVISYSSHNYGKLLDVNTGEFLVEKISGFRENDKNEIVFALRGSGASAEYTLVGKDFVLEFEKDYAFEINKNGFWAYDKVNKTAYLYDLNGKVQSEITGIEEKWDLPDDCFIFISDEGKSKIISNEDGKVIFELDYTTSDLNGEGYFPYNFDNDNIGIIQLSDGLYNLKGEKLVDINME